MILLTATALAAAPIAPDPLCPSVPDLPFGWRLDWGLAAGRNEADATVAAQEAARKRLLEAACKGVGEMRCAAAGRSITTWGTPAFDKKRQSACVAMVIKLDALQSFDLDLDRAMADVAALASAIAAAGPEPVQLEPPGWPSGCVAGDLGHALAAQLRNELAKHGTKLVSGAVRDPTAARLALTLTPLGERVTVSATRRMAGSSVETPLPGFTFPVDLYKVDAGEVGQCAGRARIGLTEGTRTGADGLTVSLFVATDDGRMCEGQHATVQVHADRPASLQLWSVIHDGRAFLIGPDPGLVPGGVVRRGGAALEFDALALEEAGDEFLVAIALPEGAQFSRSGAPCRLAEPWTPAMLPAGAAVATQTWKVVPESTGDCGAWAGAADRAKVAAMMDTMPICR